MFMSSPYTRASHSFLQMFKVILDPFSHLQFALGSQMETENDKFGNPEMFDKLFFIKDLMNTRDVAFAILNSLPNTTFEDLFDDLGPSLDETVRHCSNGGIKCTNITERHTGHFPKCFEYASSEEGIHAKASDEGISNGINFVLMSGARLASQALEKATLSYFFPVFRNTFEPVSADGFRLMISHPDVMADIDEQGIDISPGMDKMNQGYPESINFKSHF